MQVKTVQHGVGSRGAKSRITGELVCGPETLSEEELVKNRENLWQSVLTRPLDGPYYHERTGDLSKVTVPLLSAGNWGGQGLHPRGNFEGYMRAASQRKWLEVHGGSHWAPFYTDYGVKLQKRFFDFFLKGIANGWDRQPRVLLQGRHPREKFLARQRKKKHPPPPPAPRRPAASPPLPSRPYHPHAEPQPLTPGQVYELDIEIWPTCIVVPKGYRVALTVRGKDYEYEGEAATLSNMKNPMKGCGPFVHDDPVDRPPEIFGGKVTLHFGANRKAAVLLPVIPPQR